MRDPTTLPLRIPLPVVLALAGYSRSTLRNRQRAGLMPKPVDRGTSGGIYDRDAVLKALKIVKDDAPEKQDWSISADAFRKDRPRQIRGAQAPRGRHAPRAVSGAGSPSPLRLVADNSPAAQR
jgi:hypothetical protein